MMMRGLSQKKGADMMTAPSVTARSGQKAKIEVIREFIYPTEYEPPEIPNSIGGQGQAGGIGGGSSVGNIPVTPSTPTAFETRNTGVTLEIEPTIGENDFMIDLRFVPEIVEFEGFINYGSPILAPAQGARPALYDFIIEPATNLAKQVLIQEATPALPESVITENRIEMPVFSTRRVNTSLTIYDGYTVAVGGLMREVPILGDIPIVGRLFQTKAENRIKSNLIIFVTAQIIDATGRPLRGSEAAGASLPVVAPAGGTDGATDAGVLPPL
jgi:general secretion pathway protein D